MNARASFSTDSACGARATAMGGAFTAVPGGSEAACSNPATLLELSSPELTAVYGRLYSGLTDESNIGQGYFGFAAPLRYLRGPVAFSISETRLSEAYSENSYAVSYATTVYRGLGAGVTLKYLRRGYTADVDTAIDPLFTANGYSSSALGADLGFFYRHSRNYAFGLSFRNLNKPDIGLGASDPLDVETRAGFSYQGASSLFDVDAAFAGADYALSSGMEYALQQQRFLLRTGFTIGNYSRRSVNLGFGARFGLAALDYSFSMPIGGIAGTVGSHRLAFSVRFGAEAERAEGLAAAAQLQRAQDRATLQEEKVRVLQERLDAVVRHSMAAPSAAPAPVSTAVQPVPAPQPVVITQPSQADANAQAEINRQLDSLKQELEKSRAEMEALKARAAKAAVSAPPSAGVQPARRVTSYVVKSGDTLGSIAAAVYGDADRWQEIYRANAGSLGRGGEARPGQVLVIP